jgi:hypothetical protein
MSESTLRIVWIYPDLLSTYGDRGNMLILARRAALRGLPVESLEVRSDQTMPTTADIYLIGGGEDGPQALAAQRLIADGGLHRLPALRWLVLRQGVPLRRPGSARHHLRPGRDPRRRGGTRRHRPAARAAAADRFREPRRPHPPGPRRGTVGPGDRRDRQRRPDRGCLARQDPRYLRTWPGAGPQPWDCRPATALGDRRG